MMWIYTVIPLYLFPAVILAATCDPRSFDVNVQCIKPKFGGLDLLSLDFNQWNEQCQTAKSLDMDTVKSCVDQAFSSCDQNVKDMMHDKIRLLNGFIDSFILACRAGCTNNLNTLILDGMQCADDLNPLLGCTDKSEAKTLKRCVENVFKNCEEGYRLAEHVYFIHKMPTQGGDGGTGPKTCAEVKAGLEANSGGRPLLGAFIPDCTDDGGYESVQCHGSTGYCWCVYEHGGEIPGTRVGPGNPTPTCEQETQNNEPKTCAEAKEVLEAQSTSEDGVPMVGMYIPQCTDDGGYEKLQCHGSTGYCWCVNGHGGEIPGTRVGPGNPRPMCDRSGLDMADEWEAKLNEYLAGCDVEKLSFTGSAGIITGNIIMVLTIVLLTVIAK